MNVIAEPHIATESVAIHSVCKNDERSSSYGASTTNRVRAKPTAIQHVTCSYMTLHSVRVKDVKFSYHVEDVFGIDIPALQHGNDGLIYTCVNTPYLPGTDQNMYATTTFGDAFA